ncbi:MAG: hypothetical protein ACOCW3_03640 [Spirochaetota bacterium]
MRGRTPFFDLGFGRYVVDAYMPIDEHTTRPAAPPAARAGIGQMLLARCRA